MVATTASVSVPSLLALGDEAFTHYRRLGFHKTRVREFGWGTQVVI
jgi:hypothetical protein